MPAGGSDDVGQLVSLVTGRPRKGGPPGQVEREALDRQRRALANRREMEREEEREQLQLTNKKILEHLKQALGEYVPNYSAPKLRGLASPRNFSLHWGFGTPLEVLDDVELLTRMVQLKQTAREPQESGTSTTFEHPRASGSDAAIASPSSLVSAAGAAAAEHRDGQPLSIAANRCQTPLRTPPARRAPQLEPTVPGGNLMPRKPERPSTAPLSLRSPRAASPAPAAPHAAGSNSAIAAAPSSYLDVAGLTSRDDSVRQRLAEIRAQQQKEQAAVATKLAQRAEEAGRVVEATYESLCKEAQGRVAKWAGKRMQVTKRVSDAAARREAETLSELQRKTERVEAWRQEQEVVARERAEALAKERAEAAMRFGERLQAREERLQKAEESAQQQHGRKAEEQRREAERRAAESAERQRKNLEARLRMERALVERIAKTEESVQKKIQQVEQLNEHRRQELDAKRDAAKQAILKAVGLEAKPVSSPASKPSAYRPAPPLPPGAASPRGAPSPRGAAAGTSPRAAGASPRRPPKAHNGSTGLEEKVLECALCKQSFRALPGIVYLKNVAEKRAEFGDPSLMRWCEGRGEDEREAEATDEEAAGPNNRHRRHRRPIPRLQKMYEECQLCVFCTQFFTGRPHIDDARLWNAATPITKMFHITELTAKHPDHKTMTEMYTAWLRVVDPKHSRDEYTRQFHDLLQSAWTEYVQWHTAGRPASSTPGAGS